MKFKKIALIAAGAILINAPAFCGDSSADIEEQTHDEYCREIYWEDENCVEPQLIVTEEFCESIPFEGTRLACLEAVKEKNEK